MSKNKQNPEQVQPEKTPEEAPEESVQAPETEQPQKEDEVQDPLMAELEALKNQTAQQEDKYLRLAAEYDNYRRRTAKEKESIWSEAKRPRPTRRWPSCRCTTTWSGP